MSGVRVGLGLNAAHLGTDATDFLAVAKGFPATFATEPNGFAVEANGGGGAQGPSPLGPMGMI